MTFLYITWSHSLAKTLQLGRFVSSFIHILYCVTFGKLYGIPLNKCDLYHVIPHFKVFVIVVWWWSFQTETCSHSWIKYMFMFDGIIKICFKFMNTMGCPLNKKSINVNINANNYMDDTQYGSICAWHLPSNTTILLANYWKVYNYMFRPYSWAIIRLYHDLE